MFQYVCVRFKGKIQLALEGWVRDADHPCPVKSPRVISTSPNVTAAVPECLWGGVPAPAPQYRGPGEL